MFLIKLYMFPSSRSEFILFILLIGLLAPPNIPFFSNVSIEVFDALVQLLVSVFWCQRDQRSNRQSQKASSVPGISCTFGRNSASSS